MSSIVVAGDTSGSITISAPAVSGSNTLSLPAVTDTLAGIAATQTLTNKTLTSPTLTSPALGTVASGNISACTATSLAVSGFVGTAATGALTLPVGTTAQRPTPANGMERINTTTGYLEVYNGGTWYSLYSVTSPSTVEYLVVAGGGSGNRGYINDANCVGGAGGAGGFRTNTGFAVESGTPLTVTVGAGGVWVFVQNTSAPGADSVFSTITATGGGGGGMQSRLGGSGGSGGGGGGIGGETAGGAGNTPSTTPSQGNAGGAGSASSGGGGGGSSSAGGTPTKGNGTASSISGSSITYAAGGIGGQTNVQGAVGAANTGNGADGGPQGSGATGNNGGSGIVIIRYADTYSAATSTTGSPTITVAGGYRVYKWTASGTITF